MENVENEMARVSLDLLNSETQLIILDNRKQEVVKDIQEKEQMIAKYENKIRENHDIHEKKMNDVAKYNKEYEKANQKTSSSSKAVSEFMINHLKKELSEMID